MIIRDALISDCNSIAKVHVDSRKSTYKGIETEEDLARLNYEDKAHDWKIRISSNEKKEIIIVAEVDEVIIGFTSGFVHKEDVHIGEISTIYLTLEFQHKGIGQKLFEELLRRLVEDGATNLIIWTAREGNARGFYERMGG